MKSDLSIGAHFELSKIVESADSAASYGSGMVNVLASPAMIAFMENTCLQLVLPFLDDGQNTVGTEVNVRHLKPTPIGMRIWCEVILLEIEGRKLVFKVLARDEDGLIGEGTHTRFIIDVAKFMSKIIQVKNH